MYRNYNLPARSSASFKTGRTQRGSALVIAVFIMVVMLLLGAAMVRMLESSSETIAYEVIGTRAYNAASVGIQQRLATIFPLNASPLQCDGGDASAAADGTVTSVQTSSADLSTINGLQNCQVYEITCSDVKENGVTYYTIQSTGQCDINGEVTSRTLEVKARTL